MRIPRIHTQNDLKSDLVVDLDEATSRYLGKVLRMQEGRPLTLFNGQGGEFQCTIQSVTKKCVRVLVGNFINENRCSSLNIHLGIGLSKGDRLEMVLQKATELGVSHITPLFTERSEIKLSGERLEKKISHWQQIIISASEQCQRNILPILETPKQLDQWLPTLKQTHKFVLHHRSDRRLEAGLNPQNVAVIIGPEGGLSETEINQSLTAGFQPLTLGPRVLRTETAPLAVVSIMQYLWGDLAH